MLGLTMIKDYLDEILDGKKTFDVRSYPTSTRGVIALIDSKSMKVYGSVELINCREITVEDYISWHKSGKFKNMLFLADKNKKYYAYDFKNPQRVVRPFKIDAIKHTWVKLNDDIDFSYQISLF